MWRSSWWSSPLHETLELKPSTLVFAMDYTNKYRGWCFTLNNYTTGEEEHIQTVVKNQARYIVYGREVGDEGTPHLQGYVYFESRRQRKGVARLLPRAFLTPANGSAEKNRVYCTKQANGGFEFGEPPMDAEVARRKGGAGNAARYAKAIESARNNDMESVEREDPQLFLLHGVRLESLYTPTAVPLDGELLHEWWVGPSGTGKSRLLWELYPNHFSKNKNKWWDGYKREDVVAIEEWAPKNDISTDNLKIWADRYPFRGEVKGSHLGNIRPKKLIVLSNYTPQQCFLNQEDLGPMLRRFTVIHFPHQEQHARFRAEAFFEPTPLDTPSVAEETDELEDLDLPDLSLEGDFFLEE